jgi:hypothetical protein
MRIAGLGVLRRLRWLAEIRKWQLLLPHSKSLARDGERPGMVVSPRVEGLN